MKETLSVHEEYSDYRRSKVLKGMKPGTSSQSLTVMFSLISLVLVYCACVFTDYQLLFYFAASVMVMGVVAEKAAVLLFEFYIIVVGVSLFIIPDKSYILPYVFFFGYYAIAKYVLDIAVKNVYANIVIKVGIFTLGGFLVFVTQPVLFYGYVPEGWPLWAFVLMLEGIFVGYDFLFRHLTIFYLTHLRSGLKRSTY